MKKFKEGESVCLVEDKHKEKYTVEFYTGKISRGPIGQFDPSPVICVIDSRSRLWEFREDALEKQ